MRRPRNRSGCRQSRISDQTNIRSCQIYKSLTTFTSEKVTDVVIKFGLFNYWKFINLVITIHQGI